MTKLEKLKTLDSDEAADFIMNEAESYPDNYEPTCPPGQMCQLNDITCRDCWRNYFDSECEV